MNILERLLLIVPLVLIPCFGAELTNAILLYKERHEEVRRLAQASADVYNTELDEVVQGVQRLLRAVAKLPAVNSLRTSECEATLRQLAEGVPQDIVLAVS
jgi:hypothetical protein